MKRWFISALILVTLLLPSLKVSATVSYSSDLGVSNNTTTAYPELGVTASTNVTLLVSNGFISATGLDTRVQNSGSDLPYMLATDRVTFAVPVPGNSTNTYQFVTGQTAASSFQIVPGYGGYVTTADAAALELSSNGTVTYSGYIPSSGRLVDKTDFAINANSTITGNVTARINAPELSFDGAANYLTNPIANFASTNTSGSMGIWFRTSSAAFQQLLWSSDIGTIDHYLGLAIRDTTGLLKIQQDSGGGVDDLEGTIKVTDGYWHYAVVSSNGTAYSLTLDGVLDSLTVLVGSNTGDWFSNTTLRDNLVIGKYVDSSGSGGFFSGNISAVRIYSRPSVTSEAFTDYNNGMLASASDATGLIFNLPMTEGTGNPVDTVGSLTMTRTGGSLPTWQSAKWVSVAGVPHGSVVVAHLNGTNFWLTSGALTSGNVSVVAIPDNATNWVFGINDPYINYIKLSVAGTEVLWYQPIAIISGTTMPDRDAPAQDGVITWGANPTGVSTSFGSLTSTTVVTTNTSASGFVGNSLPGEVHASGNPTLVQAENAVESDWLYTFIKPFADASGTQAVFFYWFGTILVAILGFVFAYKTKHLLISAIAFDIPFGYGIAKGFVPPWVIIVLALWTIGAVIQEARM